MLQPRFALRNNIFFTLMITLVIPLSGVGIDIYLPSLPAVTNYFGVEKHLVQLTISSYIFGFAIMQFIAGPISDTYGRRNPYLLFMLVFIAASLCVPFSANIYQMLGLRIIQGASVAAAIVPIRSIISDVFSGRERDKAVNHMALAWSIGPVIAPAIGGYIQAFIGWKFNFYFLAIYSSVLFCVGFLFLPETSPERYPLHPTKVIKRYIDFLLHPEFLIGMTINGFMYSLIIVFSVVGPFLIQEQLGYSAITFGHLALLLGAAWFAGSMLNRLLIDIKLERKEKAAFIVMLATALVMLALALSFPLNLYEIIIPLLVIYMLGALIFPASFARNFEIFTKASASASSLFSGMLFLITAVTAALATKLKVASAAPLACAYIALATASLVLALIRSRLHR